MFHILSSTTFTFHQLQTVPIGIGILIGASCMAVKEDGIGTLCQRVSLGIAIGVLA